MSELSKAIGARLRELRLDAEMTLAEVARRMGSHRPIIGRAERGVHTLNLDVLSAHARALDLDLLTVLAPIDIDGLIAIDSRCTDA
jgi:transcriptional regulator with XRE-family HTH domain